MSDTPVERELLRVAGVIVERHTTITRDEMEVFDSAVMASYRELKRLRQALKDIAGTRSTDSEEQMRGRTLEALGDKYLREFVVHILETPDGNLGTFLALLMRGARP